MTSPDYWKQPRKWDREAKFANVRRRVFCASLADVFEKWPQEMRDFKGSILHRCRAGHWQGVDTLYAYGTECQSGCNRVSLPAEMDDVRRDLFALIDATPNLDWLLLTKRPENIRRMWPVAGTGKDPGAVDYLRRDNVWLGCSIATQADADANIPELLKCRDLAAQLFLSVEPLIERVDLADALFGLPQEPLEHGGESRDQSAKVDWVIVGGESGPNARPCNVGWIRSIVAQCEAAGVPCFVKQIGSRPCASGAALAQWADERTWNLDHDAIDSGNRWFPKLRDTKGGDPAEWPDDLQVREIPKSN